MVHVSRDVTAQSWFSSTESSWIHLQTSTSIDSFHASIGIDGFQSTKINFEITYACVCICTCVKKCAVQDRGGWFKYVFKNTYM